MLELERQPDDVGVEHPHGLVEQLLAGLVPAEDDDAEVLIGHACPGTSP